ncbi:MAG: type II secretion system protein GspM [Pseudomonadales bacterium]
MSVMDSVADRIAITWNAVQLSSSVQRLRAYYLGLRDRDQLALKALVVAVLCAFAFLTLKPAHDFAQQSKMAAARNAETLSWMQSNKQHFGTSSEENSREAGQSLLSVSSQAAKNWNLTLKRFEPVDDRAMRIWFEDVNFASVIQWIAELDETYNIAVRELQMDQSNGGTVNATLVLQE